MRNYKITINGKVYEVGVEEMEGVAQVQSVRSAGSVPRAVEPAPAPKAAPAPAPAAKPAPAKAAGGGGDVTAPMTGTVLSVSVSEGQQVKKGQLLLVFEAMKMENEVFAPCGGTVTRVAVSKGTALEAGTLLVSIG